MWYNHTDKGRGKQLPPARMARTGGYSKRNTEAAPSAPHYQTMSKERVW